MNYFWKHVMPWVAVVAAVLLLAFAAKANVPRLSDDELEKLSADAIRRTKEHASELVKEVLPHATAAEAKIAQLEGSIKILAVNNVDLERNLKTAQTSAAAVEKDRDDKAIMAAAEKKRADTAEKSEAVQRGLAWKWRLFCFGTWVAVVALFAFKSYLKTIPGVGLLFR